MNYFARKPYLSSNYLNDLLKKEKGKNGNEHIQLYIFELAQDKLLNTSASASEIAYDLVFEFPKYFSNMFRKKTGMTPAEYRNLN